MRHVLSMKNLSTEDIIRILDRAAEFESGAKPNLKETYTVSNLFFEPSTRTKMSFEMAERKLNLHVLPFEAATSSTVKGETLIDTVKTLEAIGVDALVIRHEAEEYYNELLNGVGISVINGGDGAGQHPSQSMLDLYTIRQEFGRFEGLTITIAGDIAHSRVARSNADALKMLGANVHYLSPLEWKGEFETVSSWEEILPSSDVVMLLRVQHERHGNDGSFSKEEYHEKYGLTLKREKMMKKDAIIMHPAPINRGVEIADELVECDRSRIFKQMHNGVFVRMAILETVLKGREK
ncbi:aspartate carbamoyltransferase catalytic subunit [Chungangia koreensis]|uniref:Aspartate carbamoyltransferase n=1 Tax=Chungangia koreensis TaxID=752657 RepID=A0ABV8X1V1_9LACT